MIRVHAKNSGILITVSCKRSSINVDLSLLRPEADILRASLQSTLPDSNTLEGKREKDLV